MNFIKEIVDLVDSRVEIATAVGLLTFTCLGALRVRRGGARTAGDAQAETLVGITTAGLVGLALVLTLLLSWVDWSILVRTLLALVLVIGAFLAASAEWVRVTLRCAGLVALAAGGVLIAGAGHDALVAGHSVNMETEVAATEARAATLRDLLGEDQAPEDIHLDLVDEAIACVRAHEESTSEEVDCGDPEASRSRDTALAEMRAQLARSQAALLLASGSEKTVDALTKALPPIPEAPPLESKVSLVQALKAGSDALLAAVPGQHENPPTITFETTTWLLIGGLLMLGWRVVERRSAQQMPGPVEVDLQAGSAGTPVVSAPTQTQASQAPDLVGDTSIDLTVDQLAVFKAALLKNVPEPAGVPGGISSGANDLAELIGSSTKGVLTALMDAARRIFSSRVGYAAHAIVLAPARSVMTTSRSGGAEKEPMDGMNQDRLWRVFVSLSDSATGKQIGIKTVAAEAPNAACAEAGFWAAAAIFERSTRVPSWLCWSSLTAGSLARYDATVGYSTRRSRSERELSHLVEAVAMAPSSGVLLQRLSEQHALRGDYAQSLMLSARAVSCHPGYMVARYRMATSAALLSEDFKSNWLALPMSQRDQVASAVAMAIEALGLQSTPKVDALASADSVRGLSRALYERLERDLKPMRLTMRLARRSERSSWNHGLNDIWSSKGDACRWRAITKTAALVVNRHEVGYGARLEDAEEVARQGIWWQPHYNLACYHARCAKDALPSDETRSRIERGKAMQSLEKALAQPDSAGISVDWASHDPDLKMLEADPWFARWCQDNLRPGEGV